MPGTRKLGKTTDQRMAMLRQQVTDFLDNGRMETTVTRAKEIKPLAEKMITLGKKGDLAAYRQALSFITRETVAHKLFKEIAPEYAERNGGRAPYVNQVDLNFAQDFFLETASGQRNTIRVSLDISNFLNLLNRNWGVSYSQYLGTNGQQYQFLSVTQKPTAANDYTLQYKMTNGLKDIYGNDISLDRTYKPDIGSYWTMQFGIKYMF